MAPIDLGWNIDDSWCLFLDRDGVLNQKKNRGYVGFKKHFRWVSGARETIKFLRENK